MAPCARAAIPAKDDGPIEIRPPRTEANRRRNLGGDAAVLKRFRVMPDALPTRPRTTRFIGRGGAGT